MLLTLPNAYGDAATNMAIDASLLDSTPAGVAVLRHYGWSEPAITFGYTQRIKDVRNTVDTDLTLCRRITGGGIVDHRNDWTYTLVINAAVPIASDPAIDLYLKLHKAIQATLLKLEVASQLAPCPKACRTPHSASRSPHPAPRTPPMADQCFVQAAANDVLNLTGAKIAGAAMKRTRAGLLIQGSIDRAALPEDFDFNSFGQALPAQLAHALGLEIGHSNDLRALFDGLRIQQERERFQSAVWLKKR